MACKRSAVRSRLAPPAFARFASFGSAKPAIGAKSEGCRGVARRAKPGWQQILRYSFHCARRCIDEVRLHPRKPRIPGHFYIGITDDLRARLAKHNAGEVPHTIKIRAMADQDLYCAFSDEDKALAFEKYLKSASGRAFAKKRL